MRFQSTFRNPPRRISRFMRPQRQSGQAYPRSKAASSGAIQNLLEMCAQLTDSSADPAILLETIAASVRQLFQATAAGILVKDDETFILKGRVAQPGEPQQQLHGAQPPSAAGKNLRRSEGVRAIVVQPPRPDEKEKTDAAALLSQAKPFADEAVKKRELHPFRLVHKEKKSLCHGLAQPLITAQSTHVLLILREKAFTKAETSACRTLGSVCRLALENRELASLSSTQQQHLLHLSDQHRKRAESLMEMVLELGSALHLPEFVENFTTRVASMMQAHCAILALAQGEKVESIGFYGIKLEKNIQRSLNAALTEFAAKYPDLKITGSGAQALGHKMAETIGWQNLTLVRLEGAEGDLLGILCLADISKELLPNDLNLLQALIGHASVALENARLFSRISQASRQWAEIFDSISDYIVVHDEQCRVLRVNRSLADFIGVTPAELIGLSMRSLISIAADTGHPSPSCHSSNNSDEYGHPSLERNYLVSTSQVHGALNEGMQTVHVIKDITDRREAERRYRELFDNVQEGVYFSSPEGHFIEVNDALVRMLGYDSREELLTVDVRTQVYVSPEQRDELLKPIR